MATKKQLPRKHAGKACTKEQEEIIRKIQTDKKLGSWLEAKHEFFENQAKYEGKEVGSEVAKKVAEKARQDPNYNKAVAGEEKKKRSTMTIGETKLGVTIVLSHEDCQDLGFKKDQLPREVIDFTRKKLGLPSREDRKKLNKGRAQ